MVNRLSALIVLSGDFDAFGGLQIYIKNYVDFLNKNKVPVEVVHRPNLLAKQYDSKKYVNSLISKKSSTLNPLLRYILTLFTFCLYGTLNCFKLAKSSNINIIHAQDTGYAGIVGLLLSKLIKKPLILHVHGKLWAQSTNNYSYYERTIGRLIARNARKIILVSSSLKSYYLGMGVEENKMQVISTCVNTKHYSGQIRVADEDVKIGFVGRLDPIKNVDGLIYAFAKALESSTCNLSLLIYGDGPDRERLSQIVKRIGVKVSFEGFTEEVAKALGNLDIFVLPSFSEGCPLSLLEAMASGKAIIASDLLGIREVVQHNQDAILVSPHNLEQLANAIHYLSHNIQKRKMLGSNAKERAMLYDSDRVYMQILGVYKSSIEP